jgi:hypothetical protein
MAYRWRIDGVFMDHEFRTVANDLEQAIKAEEARGPSEVGATDIMHQRECINRVGDPDPTCRVCYETMADIASDLRDERDEAIKAADGLRTDVAYWQNIVESAVKACDYPGLLHSELVEHIEQLRKENADLAGRLDRALCDIVNESEEAELIKQLRIDLQEHKDKSSEHLANSLDWKRQRDEALARAEKAESMEAVAANDCGKASSIIERLTAEITRLRAIARASRAKPRPWSCDACEDSGTVEKCESPGEHANRYQEPCPDCKPETLPSSALLEAAKDVVKTYGHSFIPPSSPVGRLRSAIAAEEARGSGGIEKLRTELELATQLRSNASAREAETIAFGGCSTALRIVQREIAFAERRIQAAEAAIATFEQAEEARGPSEAEQLRKERDEAMEPLSVDVGGEVLVLQRHEAVEKIRDLTDRVEKAEAMTAELMHDHDDALEYVKEIEELKSRAEKAEASANAKLQALRAWVMLNIDPEDGQTPILEAINRLLADPPSDVASVDTDDKPLRIYLEQYSSFADANQQADAGCECDALAELCRRALREGGK